MWLVRQACEKMYLNKYRLGNLIETTSIFNELVTVYYENKLCV